MKSVRLPAIISDNMVLQRSTKTPIWGWTQAGEKITIRLGDLTADTVADDQGRWQADLDLQSVASDGPFDLTVAGSHTIVVRNVIIGEVWLCSGQSNMEWFVSDSDNAKAEIAGTNLPAVRHFTVTRKIAIEPLDVLEGQWLVATPENAGGFSAVGFYFGREIHQKTGRPVGLINASWGGTDAESWTSDAQLATNERYRPSIEMRKLALTDLPGATARFKDEARQWEARNIDPLGKNVQSQGWMNADFDASAWPTMDLPTMWQDAGVEHNGILWFRREVDVPADVAAQPATLVLGVIDDFDVTYVNGKQVGRTGLETLGSWAHPRRYELPTGTLRPGRNVVAVRVIDVGGKGGFGGPGNVMKLIGEAGIELPLAGPWRYAVEQVIDVAALSPRPAEPVANNPNQPAVLYNGMISPVVPFAIRGAIWYQGENNVARHAAYADLMTLLVEGWRKDWRRGAFPFYIVQLANFQQRAKQPGDSDWARLRAAQAQVARSLPNSGLAVTIDIGDAKDIHPRNKQDVGRRLAAIALAKDYGQTIEFSGPTYVSHTVEGDRVRIRFDHATGLTADGGKPTGFALAGSDGKYVWVDGTIDGNTVVLTAPGVAAPALVQYAWADNPAVNLKNAAGLPAVPFTTQ